jgi:hypothetical protein
VSYAGELKNFESDLSSSSVIIGGGMLRRAFAVPTNLIVPNKGQDRGVRRVRLLKDSKDDCLMSVIYDAHGLALGVVIPKNTKT